MRDRNNRLNNRLNVESLEERVVLSAGLSVPMGTAYEGDLFPLASTTETLTANASATHGAAYNLPQTHQKHPFRGSGYTVAVIDSGIDYMHPALGGGFGPNARVIGGWDFVDGRTGNWVEGDSTPGPDADPMDVYGHGTMIAGIIGADSEQYPGVAPDVNLISLRVLDKNGAGDLKWLKDALDWVLEHQEEYNIVAVNMSVGVGNYSGVPPQDLLADELRQLSENGVFLTAAAGNSFYSYGSRPGLAYPAISPYVVSVGAVYDQARGAYTWSDGSKDYATAKDRVASFSQRSSELDIMAPGAIVTSTQLSHGGNDNYGTYYGTSLASAIISGSAVLAYEALDTVGRSDLVNQNHVLDIFQATGVTVKDGDDEQDNVTNTGLNFQRIDLLAAIDHIKTLAKQQPGSDGSPSHPQNPVPTPPNPTTPVESVAPDRYESNNAFAKASRLGFVQDATFNELSLHSEDDVDWYMFGVNSAGKYRLIVQVPSNTAQVQFVFHNVIRGREEEILAQVVDGRAVIEVDLRDKVNYFLEVRSVGEPSLSYSLSITDDMSAPTSSSSSPGPSAPPASAVADRFESNEVFGRAAFLGNVNNVLVDKLSLHNGTDVDYFRFQVSERRKYTIELTVVGGSGAKFTFQDVIKNQERTLHSRQTTTGAILEVDLRELANYFIKVESVDGTPVDYKLRFF